MKYLFIGGPIDGDFIEVPDDMWNFDIGIESHSPRSPGSAIGDSLVPDGLRFMKVRYEKRPFNADGNRIFVFALPRLTNTDIMRKLILQYQGIHRGGTGDR